MARLPGGRNGSTPAADERAHKRTERFPREPLRCCPGEGAIRRGGTPSAIAPRASITSAAPTTLTLPTHDLGAGAAGRPRSEITVPLRCEKAKGFCFDFRCKFLNLRCGACWAALGAKPDAIPAAWV